MVRARAHGTRSIGRVVTLLATASLLGCARATPETPTSPCPAPGPRTAEPLPFALDGDPARGGRLFLEHCRGCHARDVALRAPEAPPHAPRLDCPAWLAVVDASYLYDAINRGPGAFGHAGGPPLGERLAPMDVADLVAHLLSRQER